MYRGDSKKTMFAKLNLGLQLVAGIALVTVLTLYYGSERGSSLPWSTIGEAVEKLASAKPKIGRKNRVGIRHSLAPGASKTCRSLIQRLQMFLTDGMKDKV